MPELHDVDPETVRAHVVAYFGVRRDWVARRPYAEVRAPRAVVGEDVDRWTTRIDVRCEIAVRDPGAPHPDSGRRLDNHLFFLFGPGHGDRVAALAEFVRAAPASGDDAARTPGRDRLRRQPRPRRDPR